MAVITCLSTCKTFIKFQGFHSGLAQEQIISIFSSTITGYFPGAIEPIEAELRFIMDALSVFPKQPSKLTGSFFMQKPSLRRTTNAPSAAQKTATRSFFMKLCNFRLNDKCLPLRSKRIVVFDIRPCSAKLRISVRKFKHRLSLSLSLMNST